MPIPKQDRSDDISHRYLMPVKERQPEGNADALYAFKSRGFGGEIGVVIANIPPAPAPALCTWVAGRKSASFLI